MKSRDVRLLARLIEAVIRQMQNKNQAADQIIEDAWKEYAKRHLGVAPYRRR